jgi:MoaA/NifB/PqqE/SkfB family radical SAM enzyme
MVESIRKFVKNKRIIFVGNSVEIMNYNLAEFINKYDIVVRFGRAIEANDLQEKSLGTKCDIWITGQFRAPSYNNVKEKFISGKFKNTKILVNRCRGNLKLKDWILEDRLPKDFPEYTQMYSDDELVHIMKQFDKRPKDKRGKVSNCNPHSWHMPVYVLNRPAHDSEMEQHYVSSLQRRGLINWHLLSDLNYGSVPYTDWMKGIKIIKSAPRYSKISKILPR